MPSSASQALISSRLQSRFIINLPPEELLSPERISFQIEQAYVPWSLPHQQLAHPFPSHRHWYYEDFVRPENPKLPSYSMKDFSAALIRHVAQDKHLLTAYAKDPNGLYEKFLRYKARVPVCGAIMLNDTWDEVGVFPTSVSHRSPFPSVSSSEVTQRTPDGAFLRARSMKTSL